MSPRLRGLPPWKLVLRILVIIEECWALPNHRRSRIPKGRSTAPVGDKEMWQEEAPEGMISRVGFQVSALVTEILVSHSSVLPVRFCGRNAVQLSWNVQQGKDPRLVRSGGRVLPDMGSAPGGPRAPANSLESRGNRHCSRRWHST